jgi:hypothetical protein
MEFKMKICPPLSRHIWLVLALFAAPALAPAQSSTPVVITSADMFNQTNEYYRAYANNGTNSVDVSAYQLANTGGGLLWDFTTGPQDATNRFDYISATDGMDGSNFVALGAQIAEKKIDEADPSVTSWLYFKQDPIKGRIDYGFYDPTFSSSQPESMFTNGLRDFPNTIHYGDTWSGATVFSSVYTLPMVGDVPDQITYKATSTVDAYGVVVLPKIGFLNCLRVHELVEYDTSLDLSSLGQGWYDAGAQYSLNYYWLCPGYGIAVQIDSVPSTQPPDDGLSGGATAVVRMFETNHPQGGTPPPTSIPGFRIMLGASGALLQWTKLDSLKAYEVDYATNLAPPVIWQPLATNLTSSYLIDSAPASSNAPARYYRVVGSN